jgi:zinc protease
MKLVACIFCTMLYMTSGLAQDLTNSAINLPFDASVRTGKLSNGLTYFIKKNSKPEQRAELRLAIKVGSMMEEEDQQGLAHFCEHLCFNGTKNFPKSALVDYLESVGTKFGPHLNAYTSFDETVYMLQLPTDDETVFKKGFQILEEWAHNVTFEDEEINKERGVVVSERRNGLGADKRMSDKIFPVIFKNSRYANRLPIGQLEVLDTFPPQRVRDFYNKWYTPGNMAVIAVGDFDVDKVESIIKKQFALIPTVPDAAIPLTFEVPDHDETLVAIATDPEATMTSLGVLIKHPMVVNKTQGDYKNSLIRTLCNEMINQRLEEIRQQPNAPFVFGSAGFSNMVTTKSAFNMNMGLSESGTIPAMEVMFTEIERLKRHGFLETELERAKKNVLRRLENQYNEKDKTNSGSIVSGLVSHFLKGSPYSGIDYSWKFYQANLNNILLEETNQMIFTWLKDARNTVITLRAPEKEGVVVPSDRDIAILYRSYKRRDDILKYEDKVVSIPLMDKIPAPGKIISEKILPVINATELVFQNGATVILKKTDFKNDEIMFSAHSWGGSSLVNSFDYDDVEYAGAVLSESGIGNLSKIDLNKYMSGKRANVFPYVGELSEGLSGNFSTQDLETGLQLVNLYFTNPRIDDMGFNNFLKQQRTYLENKYARPEAVFSDSLNFLLSNYHPRRKPDDISTLMDISAEKSLQLFKERFSNAGDFTFFMVGNMDIEKTKSLLSTYIGSLPGNPANKENFVDQGIRYPQGVIAKSVEKGLEPKSNVYLIYTGTAESNLQNDAEMEAFVKLLQIKMREAIREDKGGTYGVGVNGYIRKYPAQEYNVSVSFGCDPARIDELKATALQVISNIQQQGAEEKDIVKIKEGFKRDFETSFKENRFWMNVLSDVYQEKGSFEPYASPDTLYKFYEKLSSDDFKRLANKFCTDQNFITFILKPEAKP